MEAAVTFYHDFMTKYSDPRVKHWTLMGDPGPTLLIAGVYILIVVFLLPAYMKNRKPYNLTTVIRYYNILQIVSCTAILYMMATAGWLSGEYSIGCQPIDYTSSPNAIRLLTAFHWVYFLKMFELIDTVFFVLRKKFNQVTFLHVYHHSSTFVLAYVCCKFVAGAMASLPVMLNCVIHILMYTYYYLSSFGPDWQKALAPWKRKLTIAQMIQFTIILIHSMTALPSSCKVPKQFLLIWVPNVVIIYKMFYDFYNKSYDTKKKSKTT